MGVPNTLAELRRLLAEAREAQRIYVRLRTSPSLEAARDAESRADHAARGALSRRHLSASPDAAELAQAWLDLRHRQRLYVQRRGDAELRAARTAEAAFDRLLLPPELRTVRDPHRPLFGEDGLCTR